MVWSAYPWAYSRTDRISAGEQQRTSCHRFGIVRRWGRGESCFYDSGACGHGVQHAGGALERDWLDFQGAVQVADERGDTLCHQYPGVHDTYRHCGGVLQGRGRGCLRFGTARRGLLPVADGSAAVFLLLF